MIMDKEGETMTTEVAFASQRELKCSIQLLRCFAGYYSEMAPAKIYI